MKNKKTLLLITALVSTSQMDAMQHVWQQVIGQNFGKRLIKSLPKEIAKKTFSKTMTGLNWGISAGLMFNDGIVHGINNEVFGVKLPPETKNVSDDVKSFVQNTLDTEKVNVMKIDNFILHAKATHKRILLDGDYSRSLDFLLKFRNKLKIRRNELNKLIKSNKNFNKPLATYQKNLFEQKLQRLQQLLDKYRFVLQHENNHKQENDFPRFSIAYCSIPLITNFTTYMIRRKVSPFAKSSSGIKWLFRELSKIPTGFAKLFTSYGLFIAYARHREQEADNKVPNDKTILQGGINFFEKLTADRESYKNYIKKLPPNSKEAFEENMKLFVAKWLDPHPPIEKRIKKLEERIKKLDSQCSPGN